MSVRASFRAMGTRVEVVAGDSGVVEFARREIARLEGIWSRFLPDSEVSRMNAVSGRPAVVSDDTFELVSAAVEGWRITGGLFDPLVGSALAAAGYDRSFELLSDDRPVRDLGQRRDPGSIRLDPMLPAVTLPRGAAFDPGGIGKGLAADMISASCGGVCINVGGDIRVTTPSTIDVEDPFGGAALARIALDSGAVCTSSVRSRSWSSRGRLQHHIIDPRTQVPARTELVSATVVAGEAWVAEVWAKAAVLSRVERALELLERAGCEGVLVDRSSHVFTTREFSRYAA